MLLGDAAFPSTDQYKPAKWAPIYVEPIAGSGERLLIAVAAISDNDVAVKVGQLSKFRCLFGEASDALEELCSIAMLHLEEDLRSRGEQAFHDPRHLISDMHIAKPLDAIAISAEALASQWLVSLSSFAPISPFDTIDEARFASQANIAGSLPKQVYDVVSHKNPSLAHFFRSDLQPAAARSKGKKARNYDVLVDYTGAHIVANMCPVITNKPTSMTKTLKQKLWDLDAYRGKRASGGLPLMDVRGHELLLLAPMRSVGSAATNEEQLGEMLNALEAQAAPLEIRVRSMPTVETIATHILTVEATTA